MIELSQQVLFRGKKITLKHVSDFNDPADIKPAQLDKECRLQQIHDTYFKDLSSVPTEGLTLTIPTLLSGNHLVCIVHSETKGNAVNNTLNGPISEECPASTLCLHPNCHLYLDYQSYGSE